MMGGCMPDVQRDWKQKRALTIAEASAYVGVSRGTLTNWILSGLIPFEELPGRGNGSHKFRMIRKSDLDAFLERYYHASKEKEKPVSSRREIVLLEHTS